MNRKQLIFVLVALAIVGSAGLVLYNQHRQAWSQLGAKMGDKVLPNFQPNDVAAIRIKGDAEVNVVHKNDLWRVAERNDYAASFGKITDILLKLAALKVVEANTVGPSQFARVNLDEPGSGPNGGILVEFKDSQGKVLEAVLLGKKHFKDQGEVSHALVSSDADGRYILLRQDPTTVFLISDALVGLEPRPEVWVSKDFFKVDGAKSITHTAPNAADSWKISRENDSAAWVLADAKPGEALDSKRPPMMLNSLSTASFSDVLSAGDAAKAGLDNPVVVTVETFDHFTYNFKISPKLPDESCLMTVNVSADIPTTRIIANEENPDTRKKLDAEFQEKTKKLQDKYRQEQALENWDYKVNAWILDSVTRSRGQILEGYKDVAAETQNTAASAPEKPRTGWTPQVIH
jgi:hypothetical protein